MLETGPVIDNLNCSPDADGGIRCISTCMTALDSIGTGLLSMVLRLLSSLCHDTEGRGSPDAWHSKLMGSPTLTRTGPAGVTVATGDSEGSRYKEHILLCI